MSYFRVGVYPSASLATELAASTKGKAVNLDMTAALRNLIILGCLSVQASTLHAQTEEELQRIDRELYAEELELSNKDGTTYIGDALFSRCYAQASFPKVKCID